jgi:hypothetical protein
MKMIFNFKLDLLIKYNITIKQLFILESLYYNDINSLTKYSELEGYHKDDFLNLIGNYYIINNNTIDDKIYLSKLKITKEGIDLLKDCNADIKQSTTTYRKESLDWIDEYYNLFPKGVRTAGYFVRVDKKSCEKKLIKFIKDNPEYNKEIILNATNRYITDMKSRGYSYMQTAPYFIEKNSTSTLAGYCENELNKNNKDEGNTISREKVEGI